MAYEGYNRARTENGALVYETTMQPLLDLNFRVSSLRNSWGKELVKSFVQAYYDAPEYAVKWLFYLRDVREGLGERRSFRLCMKYMAIAHPKIACEVMELIPEYGRYDDLLLFLDTPLKKEAVALIKKQLKKDQKAMEHGEPISLLAKWMPSANTSSKETRRLAGILIEEMQMQPKQYRKILSSLRAYGKVVEVDMSASRWESIQYEAVPAKAGMKYDNAFAKHDRERRLAYLEDVIRGNKNLNAKGLFPYEIVHELLRAQGRCFGIRDNMLMELLWKKLLEEGFGADFGLEDCIVVSDGSGSMLSTVSGNTSVTALEVATSLAIYFSQKLKGPFHDKAITFSHKPRFIPLSQGNTLKEKLEIILGYNEVADTNIEAVFDMLLELAVKEQAPAEQMPKQLLIISDMEFNSAATDPTVANKETLFETIGAKYRAAGYKLPRLIFWNVCGRSKTVPMVDNEEGLCLLSGFSVNAMKVAVQQERKDPAEALKQLLDSERYEPVARALKKVKI